MEELQPEELEDLVQELEGEGGAHEPLAQGIEDLLRVLKSGSPYLARQDAADQLGNVKTSGSRIIRALEAAQASDAYIEVRRAAAKALRAPVHQEYVQQHPEQLRSQPDAETVEMAVDEEEAEHLVDVLASGRPYVARQVAAEQLGQLGISSSRIVEALTAAQESDTYPEVRRAAAKALHALAHPEERQQRIPRRTPGFSNVPCLRAGAAAGLGVGLVTGVAFADRALYGGGPTFGISILVAAAVGAVVGGVFGAAVQWEEDRVACAGIGAVVAAAVAALSSLPIQLWWILRVGGP